MTRLQCLESGQSGPLLPPSLSLFCETPLNNELFLHRNRTGGIKIKMSLLINWYLNKYVCIHNRKIFSYCYEFSIYSRCVYSGIYQIFDPAFLGLSSSEASIFDAFCILVCFFNVKNTAEMITLKRSS